MFSKPNINLNHIILSSFMVHEVKTYIKYKGISSNLEQNRIVSKYIWMFQFIKIRTITLNHFKRYPNEEHTYHVKQNDDIIA